MRAPAGLVLILVTLACAACGDGDTETRISPDVGAPLDGERRVLPDGCVVDPGGGALRYRVQSGDTLTAIAKRVYGDAALWREILRANADRVTAQGHIEVGDELLIPFEGR